MNTEDNSAFGNCVEDLTLDNEVYHIIKSFAPISHARAIIKENNIIIKIPKYYNSEEIKNSYENLKKRVVKALLKDADRFKTKKLKFYNREWLKDVFGNLYLIYIKEGNFKRIEATTDGELIVVRLPKKLDEAKKDYYVAKAVINILSRILLPKLEKRVEFLNTNYFNSEINKIIIRNNTSNWGTYNRKTHNIGINFKLLFTELPILDSVIIHELAHTKVHNHSKKFWDIVYNIVPDYKEKRRWLNKNQNKILKYRGDDIVQNEPVH